MSLDGKQLVMLRAGESFTTEVTPGHHRLRAHNTLFRKVLEVTLAPDEHASFTVINKSGWGTYTLMTFLGAGPLYLTFTRDA